ncbi:hypothetical protein ACTMTJ_26350 [Phytohabitans sp. LJ34]|uniref:hypothetical protein n=1 Tax=Phytohabitans sp. LJ34 TaxID=3452217 RepID=UPI003F8B30EE
MQWDEERAGEALRTLMRDTDVPPIGSDVERARRTGRRQTISRRAAVAAAVTVIVTGTSAVAAATLRRDDPVELVADDRPVSCRLVETLALPPGATTGGVAGADGSGRYAVGYARASQEEVAAQAVLWKDKVPTVLSGVPVGDSAAVAVNSRGDVLGSPWLMRTGDPKRPAQVWLYRDGRFVNLAAPKGFQDPSASALNDRGDVVGTARSGDRWHAVVWPAGALDRPRVLAAPENALAHGIGADGTVVGETRPVVGKLKGEHQPGRPYLWTKEGRARELKVPTGWDGGGALTVHDGWVLGFVVRAKMDKGFQTQEMAPVRWRLKGGPAQILGEPTDTLNAVGNTGWFSALTVPTGWSPTVLTYVDGRIRRGPVPTADPDRKGPKGEAIPVPVIGEGAVWAQEVGHELTVLANGSPEEKAPKPGIWKCQL